MLSLRVLGLNCGTSIDAIDLALCLISQETTSSPLHLRLEKYDEVSVPAPAKRRILNMVRGKGGETSLEEVCQVGFMIGKVFADAVHIFATKHSVDLSSIDLIASHGQTVWHIPHPREECGEIRSTLQMMESTRLSQNTGRTVISDFRTGEVSAGRHGAPLVGFLDALLAGDEALSRGVQNIGGIANFSYIPRGDPLGVFELDTGPGNVFIDATMRHYTDGEMQYDKDGLWGSKGEVNDQVVEKVLGMEYFGRKLPKTTGRELFADDLALAIVSEMEKHGAQKEGVVATLTRITSESIVRALKRYLPPSKTHENQPDLDELYLCGGGAFNPTLVSHLRTSLPHTRILPLDGLGIPGVAKEAVSFALLGFEAVLGRSIIIPQHVDSREEVVLGKITPGNNWREVVGKVADFIKDMKGGKMKTVTKMLLE